jgi:hypothetical protein
LNTCRCTWNVLVTARSIWNKSRVRIKLMLPTQTFLPTVRKSETVCFLHPLSESLLGTWASSPRKVRRLRVPDEVALTLVSVESSPAYAGFVLRKAQPAVMRISHVGHKYSGAVSLKQIFLRLLRFCLFYYRNYHKRPYLLLSRFSMLPHMLLINWLYEAEFLRSWSLLSYVRSFHAFYGTFIFITVFLPLVPILRQMSAVCNISFNIILPYRPGSSDL